MYISSRVTKKEPAQGTVRKRLSVFCPHPTSAQHLPRVQGQLSQSACPLTIFALNSGTDSADSCLMFSQASSLFARPRNLLNVRLKCTSISKIHQRRNSLVAFIVEQSSSWHSESGIENVKDYSVSLSYMDGNLWSALSLSSLLYWVSIVKGWCKWIGIPLLGCFLEDQAAFRRIRCSLSYTQK